ncbi:MAG TPA: extracellular solute-binding protein [Glaciihabitans sp.]|nr:extracellular solute-binding protein [Glaciihabitans sp.]
MRAAIAVTATTAAVLAMSGCASSAPATEEFDPDAEVTLNFTWWGNDDRASKYQEAIALFEEEYPNITVNGTFTDFPAYWEKRTTEAAGGGLPDVMQFDSSQINSFGGRGLLYDLSSEFGENIDIDGIVEAAVATGELDGATYGLITGTNAWTMFQDQTLIESLGLTPWEGGSWEEYNEWMAEATAAGNGVYGGSDPTQRIQNFELSLRQQGEALYTADGELGFTEDDLNEFWSSADEARDGAVVPQQRLEELNPVSGFGANIALTEMTWDNFGAGYLADSGKVIDDIALVAPPTSDESVQDLYLKPALMLSMAATTDNPAAGAKLIDFLTNSPEVGAIFGASRGIPADEEQREGANLSGQDAVVLAYEESIADRIGDAPPLPPEGAASMEQKFWDLGKSIALDAVTVDEAVSQFFAEADVILTN